MPRPKNTQARFDPIARLIVHEDADLLVVNKPPEMLTSSGPRDKRETLWGLIRRRGEAQRLQMGIIHRLDRDASGLLVFSKNDAAYQSLKTQFFRHTVERVYMAIVNGRPAQQSGTIESRLVEWKDGTVHVTKHHGKGELAISHYGLCKVQPPYALMRVKLETGRKHQIRVHMASLGCPIVGDDFYSRPADRKKESKLQLMLAAVRLCFDHPRTGKRMEFEIDLPQHMREFLKTLGEPATAPKPNPRRT